MRSVVVAVLAAVLVAGSIGRAQEVGGVPSQGRDAFAGLPSDSTRCRAVEICEGMEPSISPDGRLVAFIGWGGDVRVYDIAAGTVQHLCKNWNSHAVAWNASGSQLAFQGGDTASTSQEWWIWLVNRDGSGLHRVSGSGPDAAHPVWSPDGKALVWTKGRRLWLADTAGTAGRFMTRAPGPYHLEFARGWMPDSIRLLYVSGSEMGEEYRLRTVGRDSSDDVAHPSPMPVVTRSEVGLSMDGRLLYRGARTEIEFAEHGPTGRMRRCFVQDSVCVWTMSLARDRSFAVFECGDEEGSSLYLVRLAAKGRR